jgi:hypothetical protein
MSNRKQKGMQTMYILVSQAKTRITMQWHARVGEHNNTLYSLTGNAEFCLKCHALFMDVIYACITGRVLDKCQFPKIN